VPGIIDNVSTIPWGQTPRLVSLDRVQLCPYITGMASTPESRVKQKVVAILREHGAYYFFPVMNGYGRAGIPDIVGCYRGRFIAIECKAGKGTTTRLQERELQSIRDTGGVALVVNENNLHDVERALKDITHETATLAAAAVACGASSTG
jgi:hypothetical protein